MATKGLLMAAICATFCATSVQAATTHVFDLSRSGPAATETTANSVELEANGLTGLFTGFYVDGMTLDATGFIVAVVVFTVAMALMQPFLAVQLRRPKILEALLLEGADPDKVDHSAGLSARQYAQRDDRNPELLQLIEKTQAKSKTKLEFGPVLR